MPIPALNYTSTNFTLIASLEPDHTWFGLEVHHPVVNTKDIPKTIKILKMMCPTVLRTECFNPLNLPFTEEVKATEIAHLFEHVLLEEMCRAQIAAGYHEAEFSGRTIWETDVFPPRRFTVKIMSGEDKLHFLSPGLQKAIAVTEAVLNSTKRATIKPPSPKLNIVITK